MAGTDGDQSDSVPPGPEGRTIGSVENTIEVLAEIRRRGGARVTELAAATGLSKSSVYKHLSTLRNADFVVKEGDEYRLGLRFLDLGGHVRNEKPGAMMIKLKLQELAEETGESAQFAVEEHGYAVVLYREVSHQGVFSKGRVGKRFQMHQTAAGKAILSRFSDDRVDEILDRRGLGDPATDAIDDRDRFFDELADVRERGVAFSRGESTEGLRAVGVPLTDPDGGVLGAFAVAGPSHRLQDERFEREIPDLVQGIVNGVELNLAYA